MDASRSRLFGNNSRAPHDHVALRRVHALLIPAGATGKEPRGFLGAIWAGLAGFPVPAWIGDAVRRALDEPPPPPDRSPVLSHNDVNTSNLIYDGPGR